MDLEWFHNWNNLTQIASDVYWRQDVLYLYIVIKNCDCWTKDDGLILSRTLQLIVSVLLLECKVPSFGFAIHCQSDEFQPAEISQSASNTFILLKKSAWHWIFVLILLQSLSMPPGLSHFVNLAINFVSPTAEVKSSKFWFW